MVYGTNISGPHKVLRKICGQLKQYHEVRALELPDIWVRNFLPVQNVQTGELYQPFFDPRYANYTPKLTAAIRQQVRGTFPHAKPCDVRIDGGNIVLTPDKKYAFCLEKQTIFRKSDLAQKAYVEQELKHALGVQEILWIPQQKGDKIGHMDGYIQFLEHFLIEGAIHILMRILCWNLCWMINLVIYYIVTTILLRAPCFAVWMEITG